MKPKYTPSFILQEYFYDSRRLASGSLFDGKHEVIVNFEFPSGHLDTDQVNVWKKRVMGCVNACEGIADPTKMVPALIRVLGFAAIVASTRQQKDFESLQKAIADVGTLTEIRENE